MATTKVFNAKDCVFIVNNVNIDDFASGDMASFSAPDDGVTLVSDAQGKYHGNQHNSSLGQLTLNLAIESAANKTMTDLAHGQQGFPVYADTPYQTISGNDCYITKIPDASWGQDESTRTWIIQIGDTNFNEKTH